MIGGLGKEGRRAVSRDETSGRVGRRRVGRIFRDEGERRGGDADKRRSNLPRLSLGLGAPHLVHPPRTLRTRSPPSSPASARRGASVCSKRGRYMMVLRAGSWVREGGDWGRSGWLPCPARHPSLSLDELSAGRVQAIGIQAKLDEGKMEMMVVREWRWRMTGAGDRRTAYRWGSRRTSKGILEWYGGRRRRVEEDTARGCGRRMRVP
ncbi:hypothetical protein R3P38DRAFT_2759356 [Favolaschia claudopus]|uniref:Uncharacterized protein n=1 Tax=Favolaschia claudopus TaxID=2862362 RepID=A0AAW0E736_9AGAR